MNRDDRIMKQAVDAIDTIDTLEVTEGLDDLGLFRFYRDVCRQITEKLTAKAEGHHRRHRAVASLDALSKAAIRFAEVDTRVPEDMPLFRATPGEPGDLAEDRAAYDKWRADGGKPSQAVSRFISKAGRRLRDRYHELVEDGTIGKLDSLLTTAVRECPHCGTRHERTADAHCATCADLRRGVEHFEQKLRDKIDEYRRRARA